MLAMIAAEAQCPHGPEKPPLLGLSMFADKDIKFSRSNAKQRIFL